MVGCTADKGRYMQAHVPSTVIHASAVPHVFHMPLFWIVSSTDNPPCQLPTHAPVSLHLEAWSPATYEAAQAQAMHSAAGSSPFADFGLALLVFIVPDGDDRILLLLSYIDVTWARNARSELRSPAFALRANKDCSQVPGVCAGQILFDPASS